MVKTETKTLERIYTIPLRKEFAKVPRWKKTNKAVTAVKQFLSKHLKSEDVKLGTSINDHLWKHGIKNPPHKVKVTVTKDEKGVVSAELFGAKKEKAVKSTKKVESKIKEKSIEQKKEESKVEESKEEAKTLQTDKPEIKEEKLPPVKDDLKATQSVPNKKNQLN